MYKIKLGFSLLLLVTSLFNGIANASDNNFPNRKIYPTLSYISLDEFESIYNNVIVVDVRSKYEYDTIHIKNALNISRAKLDFVIRMKELRAKHQNKKIVLYCNGRTCEQSYLAGQKCKENSISNVFVYDGGVFEYATANANNTMLVGKPMDSSDKLLSKEKFKQHLLNSQKFSEMMHKDNTVVIDIRDRIQRMGISLFIGLERSITLDEHDRLEQLLLAANKEKKTILIYDDAGKQVRWLQYYLEDHNIASYYFMEGGAHNYLKNLRASR